MEKVQCQLILKTEPLELPLILEYILQLFILAVSFISDHLWGNPKLDENGIY